MKISIHELKLYTIAGRDIADRKYRHQKKGLFTQVLYVYGISGRYIIKLQTVLNGDQCVYKTCYSILTHLISRTSEKPYCQNVFHPTVVF